MESKSPKHFAAGIFQKIKEWVEPSLQSVVSKTEENAAEIDALKMRLDKIESAGTWMTYQGVYQRAQDYSKGSVVTHSGSAWIALTDIPGGIPGHTPDWQLMVKRGRDARAYN